jgi:hypothetical protein
VSRAYNWDDRDENLEGPTQMWKTFTLKTKKMGDNMEMDLSEKHCEG